MKLLSVFANIVAFTKAQHHNDPLDALYDKYIMAEEDRHPNVIDFNHVLSKNSTFLFENFDMLSRSFIANHKEEWSPI